MNRIMPGVVINFDGIVGVLQGSTGRHNGMPNYYNSTNGIKALTRKCVLLARNTGIVFIPD